MFCHGLSLLWIAAGSVRAGIDWNSEKRSLLEQILKCAVFLNLCSENAICLKIYSERCSANGVCRLTMF